ncbi:rhodanese-like domain-containing protein [Aerococcaceae bacterium DSM 111022]|nr:rhodanese-like domain-containing protein [Aerococcaceae bacterium DSM 111022]
MKSISIKELESKVHEGVNVLDVREVHEFHNGHIPSAKNLPLSNLQNTAPTLDKDEHYYVVCAMGGRSQRASEYLSHLGYNVTTVNGGMTTWRGDIE